MIYLYSGTPGSGKSLHTAKDIILKLRKKQAVISNFPIDTKIVRSTALSTIREQIYKVFKKTPKKEKYMRKIGEYNYKDNSELTVEYLIDYAKRNHKKGKEGQTLLVIDECAVMFNAREWNVTGRKEWNKFFQTHRHWGYNIILVSQNDRLIDRQIRSFIEYDVRHRKANNLGFIGILISILRIQLFAAVTYWYGVREKCFTEFYTYKKIYSKIYDSYAYFTDETV